MNQIPFLKTRGFNLIEVMVAIALVAILAAIALPSYQNAITKSDRATAIADIPRIAQALERFYTYNRVYTNNFQDLSMAPVPGPAAPTILAGATGSAQYNYTLFMPGGNQTFRIQSAPVVGSTLDTRLLSQDHNGLQQRNDNDGNGWVNSWN